MSKTKKQIAPSLGSTVQGPCLLRSKVLSQTQSRLGFRLLVPGKEGRIRPGTIRSLWKSRWMFPARPTNQCLGPRRGGSGAARGTFRNQCAEQARIAALSVSTLQLYDRPDSPTLGPKPRQRCRQSGYFACFRRDAQDGGILHNLGILVKGFLMHDMYSASVFAAARYLGSAAGKERVGEKKKANGLVPSQSH
ncbi:uncharacterized protein B0I36DRAFT_311438, partial [Microdochium trichocladiopsis]